MNLFGLDITITRNKPQQEGVILNGKYVKKDECHKAHELLEKFLDTRFAELKSHVDIRINDLVNATNNYINLLKR